MILTEYWWIQIHILNNYKELEQLWTSSMIPELYSFDLENQFIINSNR